MFTIFLTVVSSRRCCSKVDAFQMEERNQPGTLNSSLHLRLASEYQRVDREVLAARRKAITIYVLDET